MREAFGGEFMIRLFLVFIVIYVGFTAVSFNYAKAFRIKNKVISYLEENDVISLGDLDCEKNLVPLIAKNQYNKTCNNGNGPVYNDQNKLSGYCCQGVVIIPKETDENKYIYSVNTYADWSVGTLNMILTFGGKNKNSQKFVNGTWEISGEATVKARKNK